MTSVLSLAVEDLRVIVRIDGEDVSRADGNAGPDPWQVLVPVNRFVATGETTTATIARCPSCGPGCFSVRAHIRREGAAVRWEWGPTGAAALVTERRTALFDAVAYDAEVARAGAEHGWETAALRAGRLILTDLALPPGIEGVKVHSGHAGTIEVSLEEPDEYQIFVTLPWDKARPDESAAEARAVLAGPTGEWSAKWHSIQGGREEPPAYAGPAWEHLEF
ncbi:hypothetical protein ACFPIJ_45525 [Dactylosporangium cerinum]|uniref:Uncharacterized protein n=1 Tax=Dactylosporangium cerinum TaxID=1434730 RepID=A0ABV9W8P0_9ACTN